MLSKIKTFLVLGSIPNIKFNFGESLFEASSFNFDTSLFFEDFFFEI